MTGPKDDWIERVRAASDIVEVVSQTVGLKRVGQNFMGRCPFHSEKTPSFSVHPGRQFYHCFSCKAGGDVFRFVQENEKVGFVEAAEMLSRRAGIPIPERRGAPTGGRGRLIEALAAAASAYEQWLADPKEGAETRRYLEGRGIANETVRVFRLGLAPPGWDHLVKKLAGRFPDEVLVQAGLASPRRTGTGVVDRFRNRLVVPLIQAGGDVVGFGARALAPAPDEPKYLNSPETAVYHKGSFLFGLEQARRHVRPGAEVIVVEGYFDAIALHQAGLPQTVATSGTALTPEHAKALRRMTNFVALTYDGDSAGREAVARSLGVLLAEGLDVVVVDLPPGEDPDTLVRRGGAEAWREVRGAATDPVSFFERHVLRSGQSGDPREAAVQAVVRLVARVTDPVRSRLLLERASEVFGLSAEVLARAVALRRTGDVSEAPVRAVVRVERSLERGLEEQLLRAWLLDAEALAEARERIGPEDFADPLCARVATWLWEGGSGLPADEEAAAMVRELAHAPESTWDWLETSRGAVRNLIVRRLKRQRKETEARLRRAASEREQRELLDRVQDLSRQIMDIERSLRDLTV